MRKIAPLAGAAGIASGLGRSAIANVVKGVLVLLAGDRRPVVPIPLGGGDLAQFVGLGFSSTLRALSNGSASQTGNI